MDSELKKIEELMTENHARNGARTLSGIFNDHNIQDGLINTEEIFQSDAKIKIVKPFEMKKWFLDLIDRLEIMRNIKIDDERTTAFFEELSKDEYTERMAHVAELWILKGNWQYKKRLALELSDFYPGKNDMAEFDGEVVFVKDIEGFATEIRTFFKEWAKGLFWSWKNQFWESVNAGQYYTTDPEITRLSSDVLKLRSINADLKENNLKLQRNMQVQEGVIEKLKGKLLDATVKIEEPE